MMRVLVANHIVVYTVLQAIAFIVAFIAAATYLIMYYIRRERNRSLVSNMLLYLGIAQTLVYGSALLRGFILPRIELPDVIEDTIALLSSYMAMSMTVWVLVTYLSVQRKVRRLQHDRRQYDRREEDGGA